MTTQTVESGSSDSINKNNWPYVFISHYSDDAPLAEAFAKMLTDCTMGLVKSFRSSDLTPGGGITYGEAFVQSIHEKLDLATHCVAILTSRSMEKPWILWEAGYAYGKKNRKVIGLRLGVKNSDLSIGPFQHFQNSSHNKDELRKLIGELLEKKDVNPKPEFLDEQIDIFRKTVDDFLETIADRQPTEYDNIYIGKTLDHTNQQIANITGIVNTLMGQFINLVGQLQGIAPIYFNTRGEVGKSILFGQRAPLNVVMPENTPVQLTREQMKALQEATRKDHLRIMRKSGNTDADTNMPESAAPAPPPTAPAPPPANVPPPKTPPDN